MSPYKKVSVAASAQLSLKKHSQVEFFNFQNFIVSSGRFPQFQLRVYQLLFVVQPFH